MRRRNLASPFLLGFALAAAWPATETHAQVVAAPCEVDPLTCLAGPIDFHRTKELLPASGGFDTGWVPANSPLQVHLAAGLWAETTVDLAGDLETSWPEVLEQRAVPTPDAGALSIHYGAEVIAEGRFSVTVLGQNFTWQGPIPYVPQFDFQVESQQSFDPWAFDGFLVTGVTEQQTLAQVSATDFVGLDIPGLDGGFELDVALELDALYKTNRIVVAELDGESVAGGPIESEGASTLASYAGGPFVEHDVHVEGSLLYEGTLHLIPAFYLEILGQSFQIPVADIPIPFSIDDKEWTFDPVRIHTPLPDIDLPLYEESDVIQFGDVAVGDELDAVVSFDNVGEALLSVQLMVQAGDPILVPADAIAVAPDGTAEVTITYAPVDDAPLEATLVLVSNDPDEPARTLSLRGGGFTPPDGGAGGGGEGGGNEGAGGNASAQGVGGGDEGTITAAGGGCDCHTGAQPGSPAGSFASLIAVVAAVAARRRRR